MRKKLLLILLIPVLLLITACDKTKIKNEEETGEKIVLEDKKLGFKTTFSYDKKEKYSDVEIENGDASAELTFENEELDIQFDMYYNTMTIETYQSTQKTRSAQKYYKEYKFGDYDAYAYGNYDSGLYISILLKEETNKMADVLFVSIDRIDNDKEVIVSDVVAGEQVQKLFNSIKFEKIKTNSKSS